MAVAGDLRSMDLAQVLQMLGLHRLEGRLILQLPDGTRHQVLCCSLGITSLPLPDLEDEETLCYVLRRRRLAGGNLVEARKRYERPGKPLGRALLEMGLIKPDWLMSLFRRWLETRLTDLFLLEEGRFVFAEEPTAPVVERLSEEERTAFFFSVNEIVMEGARRRDEWAGLAKVLRSPEEIFRQVPVARLLEGEEGEVYAACNGIRTLREVAAVTGLGLFGTALHAARLVEAGALAPLDADSLARVAQTLYQNGRLREARTLFLRRVEAVPEDAEARLKLAHILERLGEPGAAAAHHRVLSEQALADGAVPRACEHLETALRLVPTDVDALARLVGLHLRYRDRFPLADFDVVAGARTLVRIYELMHEEERAVEVLRRLIRAGVDEGHARARLVRLLVRVGRTREAAAELERAAAQALSAGDEAGAARLYRQVLRLEPGRRDVQRILDRVDAGRREARRLRRRRLTALRCGVYVGVLALLFVRLEFQARRELAGLPLGAWSAEEAYDVAAARLSAFLRRYPFLPAAREARRLLAEVEARRRAAQVAAARKAQADAAARRRRLAQAEAALERARRALAAGDLDGALASLRQAEARSRGEVAWRREVDLERNLRALRAYREEARRLRRRFETALAQKAYREAHEAARLLCERYPLAASARPLEVPVMVRSRPAGATVTGPTGALGHTPLVVFLPARTVTTLTLTLPGYEAAALAVRPLAGFSREVSLERAPVFRLEVPPPLGPSTAGAAGILLVGGGEGRLLALDLRRPGVLWDYRPQALADRAVQPAADREHAYAATAHEGLTAFELRTGRLRWRALRGRVLPWPPVLWGDRLLALDREGRLWALGRARGEVRWWVSLGALGAAPPAPGPAGVLVGTERGELLQVDPRTGRIRARRTLDSPLRGRPVALPGGWVVATAGADLLALQGPELATVWRVRLAAPPAAGPCYGAGRVYVPLRNGTLVAQRVADGVPAGPPWRAPGPWQGPVAADGRGRCAVCAGGRLWVLAADLRPQWSVALPRGGAQWVRFHGRLLLLGGRDGEVRAYRLEGGGEKP